MRRLRFIAALVCVSLLWTGAAAASGGGEGHGPDYWPVVFQAINLVLLLWLIVHFARQPVKRFLASRAEHVTREIAEASRLHGEASARLKALEEKLAGIRSEADALMAEMRREGEAEKARLIAEAREDAERIRREAERQAENEIARARVRLERELVDQAVGVAERLVREKIVPADHRRLAGEYLSRLEERA